MDLNKCFPFFQKVASIKPLAALYSLTELLQPYQPCDEVGGDISPGGSYSKELENLTANSEVVASCTLLLGTLIPLYGSYVGVQPPIHHNPQMAEQTHPNQVSCFVPNPSAASLLPAKAVGEALAAVWGALGCRGVMQCVLIESEMLTLTHTVASLARSLGNIAALMLTGEQFVLPNLLKTLSGQPHADRGERCAIAALYSGLLRDASSTDVVSDVTSYLLVLAQDSCPDVRRLAIEGLGHYHQHFAAGGEIVHSEMETVESSQSTFGNDVESDDFDEKIVHNQDSFVHEILCTLVDATVLKEDTFTSLDFDPDLQNDGGIVASNLTSTPSRSSQPKLVSAPQTPEEIVSTAALRSLGLILRIAPPEVVLSHATSLLTRLRLYAEKPCGEMRESSFKVLAGIFTSVGYSNEVQESLLLHLVSALLHLADAHTPTACASKRALMAVAPHLSYQPLSELLYAKLVAPSFDYKNLFSVLSPMLSTWCTTEQFSLLITSAAAYFTSEQAEMRASAAHLSGYLLSNAVDGGSGWSVVSGLVLLTRDDVASVRCAAVTAARLLHVLPRLL